MSRERSRPLVGSGLVALAALGAWWALGQAELGGRQLVATPWQTLAGVPGAWRPLAHNLLATLARSGGGLVLGVLLGLLVGLIAAALLPRAPLIESLLDLARSIPPVVLFPLFLLAVGFNELARVGTVAAGCLWTMALAVTTAARAPRSARRELLQLAGATRLEALAWTQPWEALGTLAVGLLASASLAVIVAVVTEMVVGAEHGIGSHVVAAQISGDAAALTLDLVALGLVGWLLNLALRSLEGWARRVAT